MTRLTGERDTRTIMTTAAAGNVARQGAEKEQGADKEKMEKRRALGRGLASLLPGPRAVAPPAPAAAGVNVGGGGAAGTRTGVSAPHNPAELRSAGQPRAAVPTSSTSATPSIPTSSISTTPSIPTSSTSATPSIPTAHF